MSFFTDKDGNMKIGRTLMTAVASVMGFCGVLGSFKTVESGERGVLITLGKVNDDPVSEGLNFKVPFIQSIKTMSIKTQKATGDKVSCPTKDLQNANIDFALNFSIDPKKVPVIYRTVGAEYVDIIIKPAILGALKDEIGRWEAQELTAARTKCTLAITKVLQEKLKSNNILISNFELQNIEFEKNFNDAIEAKVVADQKVLEQANITREKAEIAKQIVIEQEAKAKGMIQMATAEAQSITLKADAEAKAIQLRADAISKNPQVLMIEAINRWNGELPAVMSGNSGGQILDLKSIVQAKDRTSTKAAVNAVVAGQNVNTNG